MPADLTKYPSSCARTDPQCSTVCTAAACYTARAMHMSQGSMLAQLLRYGAAGRAMSAE